MEKVHKGYLKMSTMSLGQSRKMISNSLKQKFKGTMFRMLFLTMEAVHGRIQCHSVESNCPSVACMVVEDTQCQPWKPTTVIITLGEITLRLYVVPTPDGAKYRRKSVVFIAVNDT